MPSVAVELQNELTQEVSGLVERANIGERFVDESKWKFVGRLDGKLVGVVAYFAGFTQDGRELPRFVHVIIHEDFRKTPHSVALVRETEKALKEMGHKQITAYIDPKNERMTTLAKKNGFIEYAKDEDGVFYYKNL